jgi:Ca2+-binding RTX toxin-like protein
LAARHFEAGSEPDMSIGYVSSSVVSADLGEGHQLQKFKTVALNNGSYATLFSGASLPGSPVGNFALRTEVRTADGTLVGSFQLVDDFQPFVSSSESGPAFPIDILRTTNGYAVVWDDTRIGIISVRFFDNLGSPTSPVIDISDAESGTQGQAFAQTLNDDTIQIGWFTASGIVHRSLNSQTFELSPIVSDTNALTYSSLSIDKTGDGLRIVLSNFEDGQTLTYFKSGLVEVSNNIPDQSADFPREALFFKDGRVLKLSESNANATGQIFNSDGTSAGGTVLVVRQDSVTYTELNDGRFVAVWAQYDFATGPLKLHLHAQFFGNDGKVVSSDLVIRTIEIERSFDSDVLDPYAMQLADGRTVISMGIQKPGFNEDYVQHIFDPKTFTGTAANDVFGGGTFNETIRGAAGNDNLSGGGGTDQLFGDDGDDTLEGGEAADRLNGGAGTDIASYFASAAITFAFDGSITASGDVTLDTFTSIEGISGSNIDGDHLVGDQRNNMLLGNGGADRLVGQAGDDTLFGGTGADELFGGIGNDTASYQNDGTVTVALDYSFVATRSAIGDTFSSVENVIGSNYGADVIAGNSGANILSGLGGSDTLWGRAGADQLLGGKGDDFLLGQSGGDVLNGGSGTDTASYYFDGRVTAALDGSVTNKGAAAGDTYVSIEDLEGSRTGDDFLVGNSNRNFIFGWSGNDLLRGKAGSDILVGGQGADFLDGGFGFDWAYYFDDGKITVALDGSFVSEGRARGDRFSSIENVFGSEFGNDKISGNAEANYLVGAGGNDLLYGRSGDDTLEGGTGSDRLSGGSGKDMFFYDKLDSVGDTITDFAKGDVIGINALLPDQGFVAGEFLLKEYFLRNSSNLAIAEDDFFIFRTTDRTLWLDKDGSGEAAAVLIVRLLNSYNISETDILFV